MPGQINAVQREDPTTVPHSAAGESSSVSGARATAEATPVHQSQPTPSVTEASATVPGDLSAGASSEPPHSEEQKLGCEKSGKELPVAEACDPSVKSVPRSNEIFMSAGTASPLDVGEASEHLIETEAGDPHENDSETPLVCAKWKRFYLSVVNVILSKKCCWIWFALPIFCLLLIGFGVWFCGKCNETVIILVIAVGVAGTIFSCIHLWAAMDVLCCNDGNRVPKWRAWHCARLWACVTVILYIAGFSYYLYMQQGMNLENRNSTKYCDYTFYWTVLYGNSFMPLLIAFVIMVLYTAGCRRYYGYNLCK